MINIIKKNKEKKIDICNLCKLQNIKKIYKEDDTINEIIFYFRKTKEQNFIKENKDNNIFDKGNFIKLLENDHEFKFKKMNRVLLEDLLKEMKNISIENTSDKIDINNNLINIYNNTFKNLESNKLSDKKKVNICDIYII